MAIINYNSFDLDKVAPMEDPVYGNESYIESEESGFDLAKKRHEESKKKLEAKKEKDEDDIEEESSEGIFKDAINTKKDMNTSYKNLQHVMKKIESDLIKTLKSNNSSSNISKFEMSHETKKSDSFKFSDNYKTKSAIELEFSIFAILKEWKNLNEQKTIITKSLKEMNNKVYDNCKLKSGSIKTTTELKADKTLHNVIVFKCELNSKSTESYSDIGKKPENKKYIKDKAVEEYNLRHPEDTIHIRSEESALTKAVIGTAAKGIVKNIGMGVAFSVGVALCDMIVKGVTNATARRHLGNVVEPYIEQCVADMISFGEALKMIKDSDIIHELKVIDPDGHYTLNAGLDAGIKKYSEEAIKGTDQKKLTNHFKNIFVKLYKAYEAGNGFSTEDVALDYSETVINGKASSQQSAQKILTLIDSECKKCGSTFSARSNYFNSDHSFTSSLVMTPTLDVKKMCSEIERHAKKLDTEV